MVLIAPTYSGQKVTVMVKGSFDGDSDAERRFAAEAAARVYPAPHADITVDKVHGAFWRSLIARGKFNDYADPPVVVLSPLPEDDARC